MSKTKVRIYRGFPGTGKQEAINNFIKSLPRDERNACLVTSPEYLGRSLISYDLDSKTAKESYAWYFNLYVKDIMSAVKFGLPKHLIVCGLNIEAWELSPYIQMAEAFDLEYEIVTVLCPLEVAIAQNSSVPPAMLLYLSNKLTTEELPRHWIQHHSIIFAK